MSFALPYLLWLVALPALGLAWELTRRLRAAREPHPKIIRGQAGYRTLNLTWSEAGRPAGPRARWRLALGLALVIVALARPQWGRIEEPVFERSREVLVAMDLSRSMLSQDVTPSRLDRAKLLATSLLDHLQGERVGLIVFAGTAFLQSPLSADQEIFREFLPELNPDYVPEGGTNYDALLDTAIKSFGDGAADRFLVILSDGGADDDSWKARVDSLKAKGIHVISLGIASEAGAMIPDGAGGFMKDDRGAVVLDKLDSATLRELADDTGGAYADAASWVDLPQLLQATVERGRQGAFREGGRVRLGEHFQWALAPALLLLAWSFWREFPVRPRPRTLTLAVPQGRGQRSEVRDQTTEGGSQTPVGAAVAAVLLLVGLVLMGPGRAWALVETDTPPPPLLGKLVARLAASDTPAAQDWAGLANETLAWGEPMKAAQKSVPEGPVRDALAAVEAGAKLDAHGADWATLRENLEKLLDKPDEQKSQDQKNQQQQNQPKNQDKSKDQNQSNDQNQSKDQSQSKDQNQSKDQGGSKDQSGSQGQGGGKDQSQSKDNAGPASQPPSGQQPSDQKDQPGSSSSPKPGDSSPPGDQTQSPDKSQTPPPSGQQAFGDLKQPPAQQPSPPTDHGAGGTGDMQQVGGAPTQTASMGSNDPALAIPFEKLDEVRNQDSPALLYQLMQKSENPPSADPGRKKHDW